MIAVRYTPITTPLLKGGVVSSSKGTSRLAVAVPRPLLLLLLLYHPNTLGFIEERERGTILSYAASQTNAHTYASVWCNHTVRPPSLSKQAIDTHRRRHGRRRTSPSIALVSTVTDTEGTGDGGSGACLGARYDPRYTR